MKQLLWAAVFFTSPVLAEESAFVHFKALKPPEGHGPVDWGGRRGGALYQAKQPRSERTVFRRRDSR